MDANKVMIQITEYYLINIRRKLFLGYDLKRFFKAHKLIIDSLNEFMG